MMRVAVASNWRPRAHFMVPCTALPSLSRGDAIAGLLITFINIVGGFIIGVAQQDLTLAGAAENYTVLTVGDGLASQIPALIVFNVGRIAGHQNRADGIRRTVDIRPIGQLFQCAWSVHNPACCPSRPHRHPGGSISDFGIAYGRGNLGGFKARHCGCYGAN